jgi:response regulator NasT
MNAEHLCVAVADDERDIREYLQEMLPRLGCEVAAVAAGRQLVELARLTAPDLILTDIKMPDMDGISAAQEINRERPTPVILLSAHHEEDLVRRAAEANVMSYLVKPINEADLRTAIPLAMARFRERQSLAAEAAQLRQALEDRKRIEKAKGILMKRLGIDEPEAFRRMRMLASSHNRKLVEVAQEVSGADEVFQRIEAIGARGAG